MIRGAEGSFGLELVSSPLYLTCLLRCSWCAHASLRANLVPQRLWLGAYVHRCPSPSSLPSHKSPARPTRTLSRSKISTRPIHLRAGPLSSSPIPPKLPSPEFFRPGCRTETKEQSFCFRQKKYFFFLRQPHFDCVSSLCWLVALHPNAQAKVSKVVFPCQLPQMMNLLCRPYHTQLW